MKDTRNPPLPAELKMTSKGNSAIILLKRFYADSSCLRPLMQRKMILLLMLLLVSTWRRTKISLTRPVSLCLIWFLQIISPFRKLTESATMATEEALKSLLRLTLTAIHFSRLKISSPCSKIRTRLASFMSSGTCTKRKSNDSAMLDSSRKVHGFLMTGRLFAVKRVCCRLTSISNYHLKTKLNGVIRRRKTPPCLKNISEKGNLRKVSQRKCSKSSRLSKNGLVMFITKSLIFSTLTLRAEDAMISPSILVLGKYSTTFLLIREISISTPIISRGRLFALTLTRRAFRSSGSRDYLRRGGSQDSSAGLRIGQEVSSALLTNRISRQILI